MPGSAARLIASAAAFSATFGAAHALAQPVSRRPPTPVRMEASMRAGAVIGIVKDERGTVVAGVAITAIGTTQAQARTDAAGHFRLALVPGDYILRAARDGYVSPYRESVRIRAAAQIERNITITRQPGLTERKVILAGTGIGAGAADPLPVTPVVKPAGRVDSLQAWYLRHLPRTVLRDGGAVETPEPARTDFRYLPSFLDWAVAESARLASSFFSETDFTGQFNMLTTSAFSPVADGDAQMPRGVAYLSLGAAVGTHGDWRVRGAMSTAGLASWVALGEYEARDVRAHAFRMGMSYGAQRVAEAVTPSVLTSAGATRTVASIYGFDRWRVSSDLQIEYGLRADRYDYVNGRNFLSPSVGVRAAVLPKTFLVAAASNAVVAPGVDEFLPPPASGPWLPPERTFAPLDAATGFSPEHVQRLEVGAEREFGPIGRGRVVGVRWFQEHSRNQLATMFGLEGRGVGHYFVATAGDVVVRGWALKAGGWVTTRVKATVEYSLSQADWSYAPNSDALAAAIPSAFRPAGERLHDVTSTLQAKIPETQTNLVLAYRLNSALLPAEFSGLAPLLHGRFDLQLRQALPFQPIDGGRLEVLVAISNLFRDPMNGASVAGGYFDELLTTRTPRRVLGGVQVRF